MGRLKAAKVQFYEYIRVGWCCYWLHLRVMVLLQIKYESPSASLLLELFKFHFHRFKTIPKLLHDNNPEILLWNLYWKHVLCMLVISNRIYSKRSYAVVWSHDKCWN